MTGTAALPFRKMNGLGNDFVVLDGRSHAVSMDDRRARAIADRKTGIGCDQIIILREVRYCRCAHAGVEQRRRPG